MHSPSVWGAGDHVSTLVAIALSEFSIKKKKSCAPPVEQQMLRKPPRRTSASMQTLKATEIETVLPCLHSQKNKLQNLKTRYKCRNNKAVMHQSLTSAFTPGES